MIRNSSWGIAAQASQTVLLSLFFIILARHYPSESFGQFAIANGLSQMVLAFSTLGLGQWFIREVAGDPPDRGRLIDTFLSAQVYAGLAFAVLNVAIALVLYQDRSIRAIATITAANVIIENVIGTVKCLNVAELQQRRTFALTTVDALVRCVVAAAALVFPVSLVTLSLMLLAARVVALDLFLRLGTADLRFRSVLVGWRAAFGELCTLVVANWPWIVLGGTSVANWRIANIIVSKRLGLADAAVYEISYRVFAAAQMIPVVVAATVYPMLVRLFNAADTAGFRAYYQRTYRFYLLFGCVTFSFLYSYADVLVPFVFGAKYAPAALYTRQMFLAMVVFPTAFLQGNVLFAMKLERRDMWLNLFMLAVNVTICLVGLSRLPSLTVVNAALVVSLVAFHLLQDVLLIRRGMSSVRHAAVLHTVAVAHVALYVVLVERLASILLFPVYWSMVLLVLFAVKRSDAGVRGYLVRRVALTR